MLWLNPLGEVTVKDAYPLSRIEESLALLGKAKIYTSIDLAWVFWQIPVRKSNRRKTAFACELGLFECFRYNAKTDSSSATKTCESWRKHDVGLHWWLCDRHRNRGESRGLFARGREIRLAKGDFMKSEIKYLSFAVSTGAWRWS